eukprot:15397825-Heterocapsa_arctica.AAC.1
MELAVTADSTQAAQNQGLARVGLAPLRPVAQSCTYKDWRVTSGVTESRDMGSIDAILTSL